MPTRKTKATTHSNVNAAPAKKKSFLKKKFLKIPVWIWLILLVIGIAASSGDDTTTTPDVSASPTAEVVISATPESTSTPEPVATATIEPTENPTVAPTIEATATPEPTATPVPTADLTAYVLKQGDKNDDVKALQKVLISLGWLSGSADGDYGPKTVSAVKAYQDAAGLPVTGECDYDTYLSLTSSSAPAAPAPVVEEDESDEVAYIGNRNSKKFHYPSCSSVDAMKESNKVELYSRDEAIGAGYDPCGRCHP